MGSSSNCFLSVISWNCNGLYNRLSELQDFVTENNIDIILLQETKLTKTQNPKIANYNFYRTDRNPPQIPAQGGTGIFIKRNISHFPVTDIVLSSLETTSICIIVNNRKILITSAYLRHRVTFQNSDFDNILNYPDSSFIAGDLNARNMAWNCSSNNTYGKKLKDYLNSNSDVKLHVPPGPTRITRARTRSIIDLALSKNISLDLDVKVFDIFSSDHYPIQINLPLTNFINLEPPPIGINWSKYVSHLKNTPLLFPRINSINDIDKAVDEITSSIQDAKERASVVLKKTNYYKLPKYIKDMIRERNLARRLYQFDRDPAQFTLYKRLRNRVKNEIRKYKNDKNDEYLNSLSDDINNAYKLQRKLKNKTVDIPPIQDNSGNMCYSDKDKANTIANTYETQFSPNDIANLDSDRLIISTVNNFLNTNPVSDYEETAPSEVQSIINKLKDRKSPGPDKINNKAIKLLPFNFVIYLTFIINAILKYNYFPYRWKTSIICPIPKPKSVLSLAENYRPISLLNSLSKVAERIIYIRLNKFLISNNILTL